MGNQFDPMRESADPGEPAERLEISRRGFLAVGGGGLLAVGLQSYGLLRPAWAATPTLTLDLFRREDMLALRFEFHNLVLSTGTTPPTLVPQDTTKPSYVVVNLESQHVMEEPVALGSEPLGPGKIHTQAVAGSRIAFQVPRTVKSLPFTEEGLLGWWQWVMQVVSTAVPPGEEPPDPPDAPVEPGPLETDLLLTDWLHLSPDRNSTWSHPAHPVTRGDRTELWHTRLALRTADGRPATDGSAPSVRAVFAGPFKHDDTFNVISRTQAGLIVTQTSDFRNYGDPQAVTANLLLLSAMGSSLELDVTWPTGTLAKWQHRSSIGRDNYVRIEERGFLFPFGNRATKISESQRRISADGTAYLYRREFIVVEEPVKTYPAADQPHARIFPFRRVRITTTVTPNLSTQPDLIVGSSESRWVTVDMNPKRDVPFAAEAMDWAGRTVKLTCAVAWIIESEATADSAPLQTLLGTYSAYDGLADDRRRVVVLDGQKVAFAESDQPDATAFPTAKLYVGAQAFDGTPRFLPTMLGADVRLPAVEALAGAGTTATIGFDPDYVTPTAKTAAEDPVALYARVQEDIGSIGTLMDNLKLPEPPAENKPVTAGFSGAADKVGGLAAPNLTIGALSKKYGPLSGTPKGISELRNGMFDPKDFFPPLPPENAARLLGDLNLADILQEATSTGGGGNNGPAIVTVTEHVDNDPKKPPKAVVTKLDWAPKLKAFGPFVPERDDKHATLTLHGEFRIELDTGASTSTVHGDLRNFTLGLVEADPKSDKAFIALKFERLTFDSSNGAKPTLDPRLAEVEFRGPLTFVNTLQKFLSTAGKGPNIDVQPNGIEVGYTLPIPDIAVGVFSLRHMTFSAGLTLPFDGEPMTARFAFCSREHPFLVSVYVFAGGGFFALELGSKGLRVLEASIEFGGSLALDIVVASGSVTVMAGVYFKLENVDLDGQPSQNVTLTGYLRATGRVSVLGLITISAEFYLGLSWHKSGTTSVVEGEASLTVSIDILFFSASVTLHVKKTFAGGGATAMGTNGSKALALPAAAPEFADLMSRHDWHTYCDAFAA